MSHYDSLPGYFFSLSQDPTILKLMVIMNFIYGMLITALGVVMLKYNYQLVGITGRQDWIEKYLGSGSTYLAFKLVSVVLVFGGILFGFGLLDNILDPILMPLGEAIFPK